MLGKAQKIKHGLLTRMFLRDCAFFISWFGMRDARKIWHNATYSLAATLTSIAFLFFTAVGAWLSPFLPHQFGPLTASNEVVFGELLIIALSAMLFVEVRFRKYKDNIREAAAYSGRMDTIKWLLVLIITACCPVGMAMILTKN